MILYTNYSYQWTFFNESGLLYDFKQNTDHNRFTNYNGKHDKI